MLILHVGMHAALHLHVTVSQQKPFDHKSIPKFLRSYKKGDTEGTCRRASFW